MFSGDINASAIQRNIDQTRERGVKQGGDRDAGHDAEDAPKVAKEGNADQDIETADADFLADDTRVDDVAFELLGNDEEHDK